MARTRGQGLPAGVRRLRERIDQWRRTRARRTAMPAELWSEAVSLSGEGRPYAVARALKLNFEALKRRMAEAGVVAAPRARGFLELSGAQILAASGSSGSGPVVELLAPDGVRLTLRLCGGAPVDVAQVVAAFRQGRP